jgi:hypothetical protein
MDLLMAQPHLHILASFLRFWVAKLSLVGGYKFIALIEG